MSSDAATVRNDLDVIASGEKPRGELRHLLKVPGSFAAQRRITWRGAMLPLVEQVRRAKRYGRVAREDRMRGVTINDEVQFVLDPTLLARFGFPDDEPDAATMAELAGFPQYPYALDADGNKIPVWSSRYPRKQRHRDSPPRSAASEQLSDAGAGEPLDAAGEPDDEWDADVPSTPAAPPMRWTPDMVHLGLKPYSRTVFAPAPTPRVRLITPSTPPRAMTPLQADLYERLARGPRNPRPLAIPQLHHSGARAGDPPENNS